MSNLTITQAADYLRKSHDVKLSASALRRHLPSSKLQYQPLLAGTFHPTLSIWFFDESALDTFAAQYKDLQLTNPRLGKSGRGPRRKAR